MGSVTGFTAERMLEIENSTVVDGDVDGSGHLILKTRDNTPIDAGDVRGPVGPRGYNGLYDRWNYVAGITDPAAPVFSTGSQPPATATTLYFSNLADSGNSFVGLFKTIRIGSMITVQSAANTDKWIQYTTIGPFVLFANNATVAVQVKEQGPSAMAAGNVDILFTQPTAITALNLPAGLVLANTLPSGWPEGTIPLEGQAISRTTYALLFQKWGTYYGVGDGSSTFNVPDYRGRALVGQDLSQSEFNVMGESGGEKSHLLTLDEIPSHNHGPGTLGYFGVYSAATTRGLVPHGSGSRYGLTSAAVLDTDITSVTSSKGGGQEHNNLQPYRVVQWVVTTGIGGGLYPASTGQLGKGTTAQRDGFYGVPTTDADRVALANSVPLWFNTELGWEESYYVPASLSGLTVRGLISTAAPGWYPIEGQGPRILLLPSAGQAMTTGNYFVNWAPPGTGKSWRRGGAAFIDVTSGVIRPKIAGRYRFDIDVSVVNGGGTGVLYWRQLNNTGSAIIAEPFADYFTLHASYGTHIIGVMEEILMAVNDNVRVYAASVGSATFAPNADGTNQNIGHYKMEYLGPPFVNE